MLEGFPSIVQSDNGKEFRNKLLQEYLKENNVISKFGRPRRPQSQGQVERANQTLSRRIAKCLNGKTVRWIDILSKFYFILLIFLDSVNAQYNLDVHRATNKVPLQVFRKRKASMNTKALYLDLTKDLDEESQSDEEEENSSFVLNCENSIHSEEESNENLSHVVEESYSQRYLTSVNKKLQVHRRKFCVGDQVYLALDFDNNPATKKMPFQSFFSQEIYTVIQVLSDDSVLIQNVDKTLTESVFVSRIKKVKK